MSILLNCKEILKPAVEILRDKNIAEDNDDTFIYQGLLVLDTLSLHKSLPFVKKLFQAVIK